MQRALLSPLVFCSLLATSAAAAPQKGLKLNDTLPFSIDGDVVRADISADSAWTVYLADGEIDDVLELYSVPTGGGLVTQLNVPLGPIADITDWVISADGSHVAYRQSGLASTRRLFAVPIDGSAAAVELEPGNTQIRDYAFTSDGATVVFDDGNGNLNAVPSDGSAAPTVLGSGFAFFSSTRRFEITPDDTNVVYRGNDLGVATELLVVPIDGSSGPVRLNPAGAPGAVFAFRISTDGARVAFVIDDDPTSSIEFQMWSAPVDASAAAIEISGPLVAGGDVSTTALEIDATSTYVVYMADQDTDGIEELYAADLATPASSVRLNAALVAGGEVTDYALDPLGVRVVYRADQLADDVFALFSVPIDGSATSTTLFVPPSNDVHDFVISPDASFVVFRALSPVPLHHVPIDGSAAAIVLTPSTIFPHLGYQILPDLSGVIFEAANNPNQAIVQHYSAPLDGSQVLTLLNPPLPFATRIEDYDLAPDGTLSVFRADAETDNRLELFAVPPDGSLPAVRISGDMAFGTTIAGDVFNNSTSPDGNTVVYQSDQDEDEVFELFAVPSDGSSGPVQLNAPLPIGGGAFFDFHITVDSGDVIYRASQDSRDRLELYTVPIVGGSPLKLSGTMVTGGAVDFPFLFTPDESRIVFQADKDINGVGELFSTPSDGSATPIKLHEALGGAEDVFEWHVSADGSRAVFASNIDDDLVVELWSAPVDGSSARIKLNDPLVTDGDVFLGIQLGADRAVYGADLETNDVTELYSVPVDGSSSQTKLSGAMVTGGDVVGLFVNDSLVLYAADQLTDGDIELFGVPADGSTAPVRLNGDLVANGDVLSFGAEVDGEWAVYRADQSIDGVVELFSVPADGGVDPKRLHAPGFSGTDVFNFRITPDGETVLFLATLDASGSYSLYSAPIDGSELGTPVHPALLPGRGVFRFELADFGKVLYAADLRVDERFELFLSPWKGGFPPRQMNPDFVGFADVEIPGSFTPPFQLSPTGDRVLYLADQDTDDVNELFTTLLRKSDRKQQAPAPSSTVETGVSMPFSARGRASHATTHAPRQPLWMHTDPSTFLEFTPRGENAAYIESEEGDLPRGQHVLRDHEELVRLGIHPAFQERGPSGAARVDRDH